MVLDAIPTETVRITIDKDVLPEREALPHWDRGGLPLASLSAMLRAAGGRRRIIGADSCGECSPPRHANRLKMIECRMEQPVRTPTGRQPLDDNKATNLTLARTLFDACAGQSLT